MSTKKGHFAKKKKKFILGNFKPITDYKFLYNYKYGWVLNYYLYQSLILPYWYPNKVSIIEIKYIHHKFKLAIQREKKQNVEDVLTPF
jgi:hypothetical protein